MAEGDVLKDLVKENTVVTITDEGMKAYINLCPLAGDNQYTVSDIKDILTSNNVVFGIDEDALQEILDQKKYYMDILVAQGEPCVNGTDGFFEFMFKTENEKKPKILPDGSVDYSSFGDIEVVEAGTIIVKYHPATKGDNGTNVKGIVIYCKNGKELVPLKGKGFLLSEDKILYTASVTGKVEYAGGKLNVSNLLVIDGDVTHATGNVNFAGDVQIKGNIFTGMIIQAYGHVLVDGHVEAAEIIAGKDVLLKGGMQGAGKGKITAGGSVSGKFFESSNIQCKNNLNANALLNCDVIADGDVAISGKLGVIIGGSVFARRGIYATIIGNTTETKTKLILGSEKDLVPEVMKADNQIEMLEKDLEKINIGIDQITHLIEKSGKKELVDKKLYLVRAKVAKESELFVVKERKVELVENLEKAVHCKLVIQKSIYPGTKININGCIKFVDTENYNVTYQKKGMELVAVPNI